MGIKTLAFLMAGTLAAGAGLSRDEAREFVPAAAQENASAPTPAELRNATYSGLQDLDGPVTLRDGSWEGEPYVPGGASRPTVTLGQDFRVVGDLDGDGVAEAVVVLVQSSGGTGSWYYLAAVKRVQEDVENVATVLLGDRVDLRRASIEEGALRVSVVRAGEGDPSCCPGELAELGWRLADRELEPIAGLGASGRLTLDALAGAEWVLRAWSPGETVPAEPEVTLSYEDGRLSGSSGCNRYTASATAGGELPGALAVGPVAGTRMACPEPTASIESRFLAQLGGARQFGFQLGRLVVTYETQAGSRAAMLFDARAPAAAGKP